MNKILLAVLLLQSFVFSAYADVSFGRKVDGTFIPGKVAPTNYIKNPFCETKTTTPGLISPGTDSSYETGTGLEGHSCDFTAGSVGDKIFWTTNTLGIGGACEAKVTWSGNASHLKAYITDGSGTMLGSATTLSNAANYPNSIGEVTLNYQTCTNGVRVYVEVVSTSANVAKFGVSYGKATNIGTVQQAGYVGGVTISGCASSWTTTSSSFADFPTVASCVYTVDGAVTAPATNIPGMIIPSLGAGRLVLKYIGNYGKQPGTTSDSFITFFDGTGNTQEATVGNAISQLDIIGNYEGGFTYTAPKSNLSVRLRMRNSGLSQAVQLNNGRIEAFLYPSSAQTAVNMNQQHYPTIQKFTSGSGTYTTPTGVSHIRVRMVGGGGGGGGGGSGGCGNGGAGGSTTFGTSLLTSGGGGAGAGCGGVAGAGGTATIESPAYGTAIVGGRGASTGLANTANFNSGGSGASSFFGGNGNSSVNAGGNAGATNSGSGGGGGGTTATGNQYGGAGGSAGGYVEAFITSPSGTYSYAVGAAGTAGTAGTNGYAGAAGGSGYIEVTEYYAWNMPIIAQSVVSPSAGVEKVVRAVIIPTSNASCTISSQSGSWLSGTTPTAAGDCTASVAPGTFSASPTCVATVSEPSANGDQYVAKIVSASTTVIRVTNAARSAAGGSASSLNANAISIICMGPQ